MLVFQAEVFVCLIRRCCLIFNEIQSTSDKKAKIQTIIRHSKVIGYDQYNTAESTEKTQHCKIRNHLKRRKSIADQLVKMIKQNGDSYC